MAVHKLQLDDFILTDYELIAIHCTVEDNKLAFFLNKELRIKLKKERTSLELKSTKGKSAFNHFCYEDEKKDVCWHLISNKSNWNNGTSNTIGFFEDVLSVAYLVSEFKTANYIIKIENVDSVFNINEVIQTIKSIPFISLVYSIDKDKLKSKNNLIF